MEEKNIDFNRIRKRPEIDRYNRTESTNRKNQAIFDEIPTRDEQFYNDINNYPLLYSQFEDIKKNTQSMYNSIEATSRWIKNKYIQIRHKYYEINSKLEELEKKEKKLNEYYQIESKYDEINSKLEELEKKEKKLNEYYQIESKYDEINSKIEGINEKEEAFNQYYEKIFGKTTDNGEKISGLEDKLNNYNEKIQELLGLATNASLGASYRETKYSYSREIRGWTSLFFISIGVMFYFSFYFLLAYNKPIVDYFEFFTQLMTRMPIYFIFSWLGIFSVKRRNEAKRLQEEYKHKETMAKAYFGYKQEIKELGLQEDKEVMNKLMNNLVNLVNQNPNDSLNKVKKENIPTIELIKELSKAPKEVVEILNKFTGK